MSGDRISLYCSLANTTNTSNNEYCKILRSYYLMKCKEVSGNLALPTKVLSEQLRCPKCCLELDKGTCLTLKPNKLSKKQKHKQKAGKSTNSDNIVGPNNILERKCSFCKNVTKTVLTKPKRNKPVTISVNPIPKINATKISNISKDINTIKTTNNAKDNKKTKEKKIEAIKKVKHKTSNVYTNAFNVFSLKNENNTLATAVKVEPKVIKNNKKRKDKFAGLCQKAVLASAKLKEEKEKPIQNNRLHLLLKPSTG